MSKIGILYDNISGNTGDVAIGLSIKSIMQKIKVEFDELFPGNFNPSNYDTIIIGGGHLIRPSPDFYYDKFKVLGNHILNTVGILDSPHDLYYLNDYKYVTVRSSWDKERLSYLSKLVKVVPCTTMLLEDITNFSYSPKKPSLGIHLLPYIFKEDEEKCFIEWVSSLPYTVYFLPITHYNHDYIYLSRLASKIKNSLLLPLLNPLDVFTLIGKFDYFISCSLHGGIFSFIHNIPFILFNYNEKMLYFMKDRGLEQFTFTCFNEMFYSFNDLLNNIPDYSRKIIKDLNILQEHVQYLKEILPLSNSFHFKLENTDEFTQTNHQIHHLHNLIISLKGEIQVLFNEAKAKDSHITELVVALQSKDLQISELSNALQAKDVQVAERDAILTERDTQIASLTLTIHEREGQIVSLNQTVAERDGQIISLNQGIAERDGQIAAILSSTSWRLTKPMRLVGGQVKRAQRLWKLAPQIIAHKGGIWHACAKAMYVYRREGLAGIRHRLKQFQAQSQPVVDSSGRMVGTNDYDEWIRRYDTLTDEIRIKMRQMSEDFVHKPFISVIMPCYNSKPKWLRKAIESVRHQIYPHWELCIADDASTDPAIRPILEDYTRQDARIKITFRPTNGHISAASNSALTLATGEYVALLDHDDLLAEHALFWVAEAINQYPDAGLIYSDEDKVTEPGRRIDPYFKCDWNYDLFLSQNMISHLGVYKTELLRHVGGFREGFEGSQDYDLALRCIEQLRSNQIIHIPRVLYHWRLHTASAAMTAQAKPYAFMAAERALKEHLARKGIAAQAEFITAFHSYRVRYALPEQPPLVTLIILTRNGLHLIRQCIGSILEKTDYMHYEILVIDNGSDDPQTLAYFDTLRNEPRIRIIRDACPFNFSALNNRAVQEARGEFIGLINNDIEVINREWLSEMISIALQPGVGAVGARLWYPNDTLQHGGIVLGIGGIAGHSHKTFPKGHPGYFGRAVLQQSFSAVTAACLVVRRSIFLEVGGFDEENLKVAFGDVDFCLRVRESGYRNVWTPYAELYHHESATRGYEDTPEKQARFAREVWYMQNRWSKLLLNDPAYSPNLTLDGENFSYAFPPRVTSLEDLDFD